ncbi:hypothetical protein GALMADRAFT_146582 [Galerina marginata CBS 339.88]|uniref:G-protein coupled receptors family 1 profile domain-containing protein n=1 Tax=Galerina marginata (strain CBS 339.88) TaxID=685588 RepID=A0A067SK55_GALM3|nr:hypothetical protein GALMADRAFT_146582 [Galerina marginata CBS 339.88]
MSGTDGLNLPPVALQKSEINSTLNSIIMGTFLMGIYTTVYLGTLYIHLTTGRVKQSKIVVITMTLLYMLGIAQLGIQWYVCCWNFVGNGNTRETVFVSLYDAPVWTRLAINITSFSMCIIADGLLIWRCFYVWNRSKRVISFLVLLFISEIGLYVAEIMVVCIEANFRAVTAKEAFNLNALESALYFVSFTTTVTTTLLISYRIHSVRRDTPFSTGRLSHVTDIVLQSGAVYACAMFTSAVAAVVPDNGSATSRVFALSSYATALLVPIAGIAPTVMIARVSWESANNRINPSSSTFRISSLQFHGSQSTDNDAGEWIPAGRSSDSMEQGSSPEQRYKPTTREKSFKNSTLAARLA